MKKTKIYWNGKRLKDVYVGASRWEVFKYRVRKFFRKVILLAILFLIFYVAGQFIKAYYPVLKYEAIEEVKAQEIEKDTLKEKIETLKWEVVDGIKNHESMGYDEDDGLITYDPLVSNPKKTTKKDIPSIGTYQFKQTTVQFYYKKLYGKDITMKEAILIALDDSQAKQLAYDIVWKDNGLSNWRNYANKESTKVKLSIINKLQN